jgi:hypothetical protein
MADEAQVVEQDSEQEHHYFVSTFYGWAAKPDLWEALSALKKTGGVSGTAKKGTEYLVYRVPGPHTAGYRISFYAPQVEGTEFIARGAF